MVALAEKIAQITPGRLEKSFFTSSGSEANETAIDSARMHTGNLEIIALRHSYSGRTSVDALAHRHRRLAQRRRTRSASCMR